MTDAWVSMNALSTEMTDAPTVTSEAPLSTVLVSVDPLVAVLRSFSSA